MPTLTLPDENATLALGAALFLELGRLGKTQNIIYGGPNSNQADLELAMMRSDFWGGVNACRAENIRENRRPPRMLDRTALPRQMPVEVDRRSRAHGAIAGAEMAFSTAGTSRRRRTPWSR